MSVRKPWDVLGFRNCDFVCMRYVRVFFFGKFACTSIECCDIWLSLVIIHMVDSGFKLAFSMDVGMSWLNHVKYCCIIWIFIFLFCINALW